MKMQGSLEFTVTERSEGRVVSEMPIGSGVKNPFGVVHAGAMLWLADVTAPFLSWGRIKRRKVRKGFPSLSASTQISSVIRKRVRSERFPPS